MASCHTHAANKLYSRRSFWRRRASHRLHSKLLTQDILPQIADAHRLGEPTKLSSHRTHRNDWRKIFSHRFHRCSQIRRVWHPAMPTQPTKGVQLSQLHQQNRWHLCSVGALLALASGKAERRQVHPLRGTNICVDLKSVGELYAARNFREFGEFCGRNSRGWRGYGRMPYPPNL